MFRRPLRGEVPPNCIERIEEYHEGSILNQRKHKSSYQAPGSDGTAGGVQSLVSHSGLMPVISGAKPAVLTDSEGHTIVCDKSFAMSMRPSKVQSPSAKPNASVSTTRLSKGYMVSTRWSACIVAGK